MTSDSENDDSEIPLRPNLDRSDDTSTDQWLTYKPLNTSVNF